MKGSTTTKLFKVRKKEKENKGKQNFRGLLYHHRGHGCQYNHGFWCNTANQLCDTKQSFLIYSIPQPDRSSLGAYRLPPHIPKSKRILLKWRRWRNELKNKLVQLAGIKIVIYDIGGTAISQPEKRPCFPLFLQGLCSVFCLLHCILQTLLLEYWFHVKAFSIKASKRKKNNKGKLLKHN